MRRPTTTPLDAEHARRIARANPALFTAPYAPRGQRRERQHELTMFLCDAPFAKRTAEMRAELELSRRKRRRSPQR